MPLSFGIALLVGGSAFAYSPSSSTPSTRFPTRRERVNIHLSAVSGEYDGVNGLTDDGDFAMFGINVEEEEDDTTTADAGVEGLAASPPTPNKGTDIGWQGVGGMLFNEELLKSGRVDLGVGQANKYRDFRGNEVVPKIDPAVKEWLLEVLPSLNESDLAVYAEGLTNIGFHPECVSMCELKYEDLDFMKALHRRYLFKEVTGQEHPFEP